ncbi:MAG: beta-lactamase family protein [Eubacterium sp.]|nr:beta-lactamase family protein [Eubacterium sp.]
MKNINLNIRKRVIAFLMLLVCVSGLLGVSISYTNAEEGKNAEDAAETSEKNGIRDAAEIEKDITKLIEENSGETPSVSISVFDQTDDIYSVVYGNADIENNVAADENTVYEWGSVSKLLVWTSAMQLYEEGKLDLEKDIREYLPKDFFQYLSYDEPITMLNLMNHNAGFQSPYRDVETSELEQLMPLDEALKETEPAQIFAPGEVVAYSNWGAALAAYVIENVSGMNYADYVNQNIFKKLGMEHTAIKPDLSDNAWVAENRDKTHCYYYEDEKLNSMGECRAYIHIYPAGSATGTIGDLKTFAKAFLCDSKDSPLFSKPDTLDTLLSPTCFFADGKTPRFCHGFEVDYSGALLLGHGGNTTGFTALLEFDRSSKTGFVMMTNAQGSRVYRSKLPDIIYGENDYSSLREDNFTKLDFSGHYIMSGGEFEKGCFYIYSFLKDRLHVRVQNGEYTSNSGISSIEQISDDAAIFTLVNGEKKLYFIKTDKEGNITGLENTSTDFIKMSNFRFTIEIILMVTLILALTIMMVLLVAHCIKIRFFKEPDVKRYKLCEINLGVAESILASAIVLTFFFGVYNKILRVIFCIAAMAFLGLMLDLLILCHRRSIKGKVTKVLILEDVCCFFITAGFIYWKLYQFWGF